MIKKQLTHISEAEIDADNDIIQRCKISSLIYVDF